MLYIPKLFLETTVFNFYFDGKQGNKRLATIELFGQIVAGKYVAYTSDEVSNELMKSTRAKEMVELMGKYGVSTLKVNEQIEHLADIYNAEKIIPPRFRADAIHIATATYFGMDFVLSFNMGHLVKQKTNVATGFVNLDEGYEKVVLCTPEEVINYDTRRTKRRTKGL
jgi:predicted nucleic acid-binding protein